MQYNLNSEDNKQIGWGGLWWHPENQYFSSQVININELKKFDSDVKIIIKKNKYYDRDKKRPNYSFCIREAKEKNNINKEKNTKTSDRELSSFSTDDLLKEIKRRIEYAEN